MAAEAQGKKIYHLNIGQPDLPTPPAYYEAIRNFDEKTLAYDASPGNAGLITVIIELINMVDLLKIDIALLVKLYKELKKYVEKIIQFQFVIV